VSPVGHALHVLPPVPHAPELVPVSQKPSASQHPVGQVFALHVVPVHAPAVHESPGGQGRQALPPVPQAEVLVPDSQFPKLSQHPIGQLDALHVVPWHDPLLQVSPGGHATHAAPPLPQEVVLSPDWQVPVASQQPVGQVEALQGGSWQAPALQLSPVGQSAHNAPPVPQALVLVPASQNPRTSQHPIGHVIGPHATPTQAPARQESPGGHGRHAPPPVPHAEVLVPDSHLPKLSQHPVGQLVELHVVP
jgi:hypothetical protein